MKIAVFIYSQSGQAKEAAKKIFDVANKNDFQVIVITRDIILVKAVSPFYADGRKKYRYWTFFTEEEWRELKAEEAEA